MFQLHKDGSVWQSTETACQNGFCPGWAKLDGNPATAEIAASGLTVFQRHKDGTVWRYSPPSCGPQGCQGGGVVPGSWYQLGDGSVPAMNIVAGTDTVYALTPDRWIYRWGWKGCSGTGCSGWTAIDNTQLALTFTAGGTTLYKLHRDGTVLRSTGDPCGVVYCLGWTQLGGTSTSVEITASASYVFRMLLDGSIWREVTGIGGTVQWREMDNNPATLRIVAANAT